MIFQTKIFYEVFLRIWHKNFSLYFFIAFIAVCFHSAMSAQEEEQRAATLVAISRVKSGTLTSKAEFVGTVYYPQVSDVAAEVSGKVDHVNFDEGQRVKKGYTLVTINSELLQKNIKTKEALRDQLLSELELALRDRKRIEKLFHEKAISEQIYDEHIFRVTGLEKKSASVIAELEGLNVELQKKTVKAPFNGVILKKHIDVGEWVSPGSQVATVAQDTIIDVIVNIPEEVCKFINKGVEAEIRASGKVLHGKVFTVIPKGDISTRTFPVIIRMKNQESLMAGMEAKVTLPTGKERDTYLVERDAIIHAFGETVIFTVKDSHAAMIPVQVLGYNGMMAGIEANGIREGMEIIVKGNERLRDGQRIRIVKTER